MVVTQQRVAALPAQPPAASIISENQQVNGFDVQKGRLACPH
jgi:hypothetical protein